MASEHDAIVEGESAPRHELDRAIHVGAPLFVILFVRGANTVHWDFSILGIVAQSSRHTRRPRGSMALAEQCRMTGGVAERNCANKVRTSY